MPLLRGLRPTSVQRSAASGASSVTLVRPKLAAEPDALAAKADDARPAEPLPAEAQRLKEMLLRQRSRLHRFSLSRMRKVVVPPVEIPPPLDVPGGLAYLVSGVKIPMTLDMFLRHRKRLLRHLPARIDEAAAY